MRRPAPIVDRMQGGDIALAGFVLTAEEWHAMDPGSRAQLIAAAYAGEPPGEQVPLGCHRDAPWLTAPISGLLSEVGAADAADDKRG
ncbi:MAG: hypothetical protein KF773_41650 [Deltaproteobacteria bacterium]|nr:hypothetical protein [Deltaproteobacteria bacterium]MCW5809327.1 hypothetical protein [Deltaproteobacteria bacterium]